MLKIEKIDKVEEGEKMKEILFSVRKHNEVLYKIEPRVMNEVQLTSHGDWVDVKFEYMGWTLSASLYMRKWLQDFILGDKKEEVISWLKENPGQKITIFL